MSFCKKCGNALDEDAVFCQHCGTKVTMPKDVPTEGKLDDSFDEVKSTKTAFIETHTGVSKPVYSNDVGFFRYNFEKECLEFINHQTRMVAQIWNVPRDQWDKLPSQEQYCEDIVDQETENATKFQKGKKKIERATVLCIIELFAFIFAAVPFSDYLGYKKGLVAIIYLIISVSVIGITWVSAVKSATK